MSSEKSKRSVLVRETQLLPEDSRQQYLQKLARIALDEMYQFVGVLDVDGTVLEANRAALEGVGLARSDVEGKPFWECFWWAVSSEIQEQLKNAVAKAAQGEFVRYDVEVFGSGRGSETIIIDFSIIPVKDHNGCVVFLIPEGRDITEKKAREREIAQKNLDLQGLLERIYELDEVKTQFFANVSHELRTPLALILGPAQKLVDDKGTMDKTERKESATVIARNARMLLKHVNDLLDISKLDAGKLKIDLQETDVSALVRLLSSHFTVLATERNIEYVVEAKESCVAAVDSDKLQRVVMNLLANAFKFVPSGGRVRGKLTRAPRELCISVEDSGPGVKPELRQRIFERFRQGEGGTNRKVGGTGLGLAIAKEFVELHKGRIDVLDSELGGAKFQITLPIRKISLPSTLEQANLSLENIDRTTLEGLIEELHASPVYRKGELEVSNSSKRKVLVVEDNPDMNHFITQCLSTDYQVISAFDGREGLEKAIKHHPSMIVSDIMMPNVSGVEMVAEIRKIKELKQTPILLLSAKTDEELLVKLLEDGAQDFIIKPFSERTLLVRVKNLILAQQDREQVNGLRVAAESANRAKDEFLAMLGHELRNPLSPILTALQLMKLQGMAGSERARTVIERQVKHLTRLVDDLLDVSRIARGKVELQTEIIEVSDVVAKAIEMASPLLEQRNHTLTVDVPRQGLQVNADPTRLSQVISNLLTNAAKYTPTGGKIIVCAMQQDLDIILSVKDNGIGINKEVLPHIFDLFVQEHQAIDRSQGGLGIGLAIVRNLIERHGGSVSANSDGPSCGSEFIVRLPKVTDHLALTSSRTGLVAPSDPITKNGKTSKILVVDDNEDAAEMLAAVLSRKGYDTRVANDAPTALKEAVEFLPDIAFLDIGLPVMDGYELAAHLRIIPGLSDLYLIAITGYGQKTDRDKTQEAGFHHHLVKPVDVETIEAVLRSRNSS